MKQITENKFSYNIKKIIFDNEFDDTDLDNPLNLNNKDLICVFTSCKKSYKTLKKWTAHFRCHVKLYINFFRKITKNTNVICVIKLSI